MHRIINTALAAIELLCAPALASASHPALALVAGALAFANGAAAFSGFEARS